MPSIRRKDSGAWLVWLAVILTVGGILTAFLLASRTNGGLIETTCHLINLEETNKKISCSTVTYELFGIKLYQEVSKKAFREYRYIKATVSMEHVNQTCRHKLATLFRSPEEAEEMHYTYSADECKHGVWDITDFVSNLGSDGKLRCTYRPSRLHEAYIVYPSLLCYVIPVVAVLALIVFGFLKTLLFCRETSMEESIHYLENNNLRRVKKCFNRQNVNEEVWTNEVVILSPLAIATQCGHVQIMEYLWTIEADLDYLEDETERTILHFACQSGQPETIEWCLEKDTPVNSLTSQNQTPLLVYVQTTRNPNIDIIQRFIQAGTDVNIIDDANSSVLHCACMSHNWGRDVQRQVVELFIKAGCLAHNGFGLLNISPLSLLLVQGEYDLCELLIEAGYQIRSDATLPYTLQYVQDIPDMQRTNLNQELQTIPPLQRLCRTVIRSSLGTNRTQYDCNLPLPNKLKQFLRLDGIVHVSET